ncbi:MAG TPA: type II toxin-antitoxin system RelE/ParE family toxin [Bauldia sp.]|nr:type II toxin-antitoxin system RelE/ParE family toxin [Bauldia sp.]
MTLEWSSRALGDLHRFAAFLENDQPDVAKHIAAALTEKVTPLAVFPELGVAVSKRRHFRSMVLRVLNGSYVVQYQIIGDIVRVLRVFHAREDRP